MSGSPLRQKFHSPSRFPSLFLSSLEKERMSSLVSTVIVSLAVAGEAGWARLVVICINPALAQMIDGTEKPKIPSKFAKQAARYNEFGCRFIILCFTRNSFACIKMPIFWTTINKSRLLPIIGRFQRFEKQQHWKHNTSRLAIPVCGILQTFYPRII